MLESVGCEYFVRSYRHSSKIVFLHRLGIIGIKIPIGMLGMIGKIGKIWQNHFPP